MLLRYASHIPAHTRLGRAVADDARLAWAFPFLAEYPEADLLLVGGAARDLYLGHEPHELHMVVRGTPLRTVERFFARRGGSTRDTHGLRLTPSGTEGAIDLSLPRTDVYHPREKSMVYRFDHTLPLSHDANWRDLSMNAMAYSLRQGTFSDAYRGLQALDRGHVTALGHAPRRFAARPLHALRALRLAGNFRLTPDSQTWDGIYQTLPHLQGVHYHDDGHRYHVPRAAVGRELVRFLSREPGVNWRLLGQSGGTNLFFQGLTHPAAERVLHTLHQQRSPLSTAFSALAYPHGDTNRLSTWADQWQIAHHPEVQRGAALARQLQRLTYAHPDQLQPTEVLQLFPAHDQHDLHALGSALAAHGALDAEVGRRLYALQRLHLQYSWRTATAPKLRGRDLLAQGYAPGPALRLALRELRNQQLSH